MHIRGLLASVLLAVAPLTLHATNPTIRVNGDPPNATPVTGTGFGFGADQNGGGIFSFMNDSGVNWRSLDITVTLNRLTGITCTSDAFGVCVVTHTQNGSNFTYSMAFGGNGAVGIVNGEVFSIGLNDVPGTDKGEWGSGTDFRAVANGPEPAALTLTFAGAAFLGGLLFYRRRRCPLA